MSDFKFKPYNKALDVRGGVEKGPPDISKGVKAYGLNEDFEKKENNEENKALDDHLPHADEGVKAKGLNDGSDLPKVDKTKAKILKFAPVQKEVNCRGLGTNIKKIIASLIVMCLLVSMILGLIAGSMTPAYAASNQTTIIMIDNVKSTYDIGEKVKVTVGVSATDGSYLKSADVGFGYNAATMKKLTETDTEDHFTVSSDTPSKWLYYSMDFEMTANGKMYFIAGAYSGDGVIVGRRADGSRIDLPRASVVYKIGTGIYTKTSDCNLSEISIKDKKTGNEISFNRNFDKNIVEYSGSVSADVSELEIDAKAENPDDEVILPELKLNPGDNCVNVGVKAVDGTIKEYKFNIHRPNQVVEVSDIIIKDNNGSEIHYNFDPEQNSYEITVGNDTDSVNFDLKAANNYTKAEYPISNDIETGYNVKIVKAYTDTDEKTYSFNIVREFSPLTLSSLVVELSDETSPEFDKPFDPNVTEYSLKDNVPADVKSAKLIYTLGNSEDHVKESNLEFPLNSGDTTLSLTVTDGINEKVYSVSLTKDEYEYIDVQDETEPETTVVVPADYTENMPTNLIAFLVIGLTIFAGFVLVLVGILFKQNSQYQKTDEAKAEQNEKDRKRRLKAKAKERKKNNKE